MNGNCKSPLPCLLKLFKFHVVGVSVHHACSSSKLQVAAPKSIMIKYCNSNIKHHRNKKTICRLDELFSGLNFLPGKCLPDWNLFPGILCLSCKGMLPVSNRVVVSTSPTQHTERLNYWGQNDYMPKILF